MFVFPTVATSPARRASASHLLDALLSQPAQPASSARVPPMDVSEDEAGYILAFDVPGARREELQLTVHGRRVVLATEPTPTPAADGPAPQGAATAAAAPAPRALYRERGAPRYARTVVLPAEVDAASASARFDNGVLTLTLARREAAGARRVAIG